MATTPEFGIITNRLFDEPRPGVPGSFSTIGLIVTAPDADAAAYPEGVPVLINSTDTDALTALGATGTARPQLDLINANIGNRSAEVVIMRVVGGVDDASTMSTIIDALPSLESAPEQLGVTPRLIAIPGYTHQQDTPTTANPVVAALGGVLDKLRAHAVVTGPGTSLQAFTDWRETVAGQRLIPQETWVKVGVDADTVDSAGAILGMIVAQDAANSGVPSKVPANRAMQGIVAPGRAIPFSIADGSTEGQQILAQDGGIILRGERGVDGAIGDAGFIYVGYATAAEDDLYRFFNVSRMRDYMELLMQNTIQFYLGRYNITSRTVEIILQTMQGLIDDLRATGDILDGRRSYDPAKNSPEDLRMGKLHVAFRAEEPPVLRQITIDSGRYREALVNAFASFNV